jgi:hypothetical protein
VETKGKTLEEIDALFEGQKHSDVPDVEMVRKGKEIINVEAVEKQLNKQHLAADVGTTAEVEQEGPGPGRAADKHPKAQIAKRQRPRIDLATDKKYAWN